MEKKYLENIIIGGGLVGSITAWILANNNKQGLLIEKNKDPGGVNGSFSDPEGNWFDHGRHVILADRNDFTSDFFRKVLNNNIHEFELQRGICIQDQIIPYAAELKDWPGHIRDRIQLNENHAGVYLGANREELGNAYGEWFARMVYDEMLEAYPTLMWKKQNGTPEEALLDWIFPWFFPRTVLEMNPKQTLESGVYSDESRLYHYNARYANPPSEPVLYPSGEGGYAQWIQSMLSESKGKISIMTGVEDMEINIDPEKMYVKSIRSGAYEYVAENVFWCAPLPVLCKIMRWRLPKGEPQWELLGSFTFPKTVNSSYHEILFANPSHKIRRINLPGLFSGNEKSYTLQVEFTTLGDDIQKSSDEWRDEWLRSLYELNIVEEGIQPSFYQFEKVSRGIVSTENLEDFLKECETRVSSSKESNMIVPHMAVASDNNSRLVPKIFNRVESFLHS